RRVLARMAGAARLRRDVTLLGHLDRAARHAAFGNHRIDSEKAHPAECDTDSGDHGQRCEADGSFVIATVPTEAHDMWPTSVSRSDRARIGPECYRRTAPDAGRILPGWCSSSY